MEQNKANGSNKIIKKYLNNFNQNLKNSSSSNIKQNGFKWAIIVLLVVLILSVIISAILILNRYNLTEKNKQTMFRETSILVKENSSSLSAVILESNVVLGVEYLKSVKLKSEGLQTEQVLRAKAEVVCENGEVQMVELKTDDRWFLAEDGYVYFKEIFNNETTVDLCKAIILPEKIIGKTENFNAVIVFTVESLQNSLNIAKTVWGVEPLG